MRPDHAGRAAAEIRAWLSLAEQTPKIKRADAAGPLPQLHELDVVGDAPVDHALGIGRSLVRGLMMASPGGRGARVFPAIRRERVVPRQLVHLEPRQFDDEGVSRLTFV